MKKFLYGFIAAVACIVVGYVAIVFVPGFFTQHKDVRSDNPAKTNGQASLCDVERHTCASFDRVQKSGTLKVIMTANGAPMTGLEVDVATRPGAPQYYMNTTDNNGVALFDGLPVGDEIIYFNGTNFPKEYGDAPTISVTIVQDQTLERTIELKSTSK